MGHTLNIDSKYALNLRLKALLFERTPYAAIATDMEDKILVWNGRAVKKFGYTQEQVLGQNISIIIPAEHKEAYLLSHDIDDGIELQAVHQDGHRFPVHVKLITINDDGFKTRGVYIRNIEKEKLKEQNILERILFLEKTEVFADVGGWHWDTLIDKVTVSTNFRRLFYIDEDEEVTSKMLMELIYPPDQLETGLTIVKAREEKKDYVTHYRRLQADGDLALIECKGFIILDEDGEESGIEGVIRKHEFSDGKQFLGGD